MSWRLSTSPRACAAHAASNPRFPFLPSEGPGPCSIAQSHAVEPRRDRQIKGCETSEWSKWQEYLLKLFRAEIPAM